MLRYQVAAIRMWIGTYETDERGACDDVVVASGIVSGGHRRVLPGRQQDDPVRYLSLG